MSVEALRSYRLMEAEITDLEITWRKPSKRAPSQALILKAYVRRVFRSLEDPAVTRTLRDVMKPAGCGAFKDVFVLDGHLLVVKMMLRDRSLGTWMQNLTSTMTSFRTGWDGILFQGNSLCSQKVPRLSAADAIASIEQEKLMAEYMSMLEVLFEFMREGIFPWDAKLDNLGIAQRGVFGKWVMHDLDGLRAVGEEDKYKNLGRGMRMILQNIVSQDQGFVDGLRANGLMRVVVDEVPPPRESDRTGWERSGDGGDGPGERKVPKISGWGRDDFCTCFESDCTLRGENWNLSDSDIEEAHLRWREACALQKKLCDLQTSAGADKEPDSLQEFRDLQEELIMLHNWKFRTKENMRSQLSRLGRAQAAQAAP
ncbi:unnamed protein product [Cladocopium goreaui]|uniref:Uncharacterized protein n=1 Tax=Cladocopium goreaui TaxID=2562237 RepID=A0A9P1DV47_9DINO|nr:unnamed protein product [Cladocopium goreaui]